MLQREREAEGDMYADKEEFVTQAYKDQMAEVRRAEEEEKQREGMPPYFRRALIMLMVFEQRQRRKSVVVDPQGLRSSTNKC
jgi:hypothetical protein